MLTNSVGCVLLTAASIIATMQMADGGAVRACKLIVSSKRVVRVQGDDADRLVLTADSLYRVVSYFVKRKGAASSRDTGSAGDPLELPTC